MQKLIEKGFCDNVQLLKSQFETGARSEMLEVVACLGKLLAHMSPHV